MIYDKEDMMGVLENFPKQCIEAVKLGKKTNIKGKFTSVTVCGMGGSGIGADLLKSLVTTIPVYPVHGYHLPKFLDKKSLVVCISFSGNTEETLSCYKEAKKKKMKTFCITSGGKLAEMEKDALIVPSGIQPRNAIGYLFLSMLTALSKAKVIPNQASGINEAIKFLHPKTCSRKGFLLAQKFRNKLPIFQASDEMAAVAYRIKTAVNENAKQPAFWHYYPELNHNELNGFKKNANKVGIVLLSSKHEDHKINKRINVTKKVLKKYVDIAEMEVLGKSLLARMMYAIYVGDFMSYYMALMNKEDPTPVGMVEEFKNKLKK